jgi:hypothetical protein
MAAGQPLADRFASVDRASSRARRRTAYHRSGDDHQVAEEMFK